MHYCPVEMQYSLVEEGSIVRCLERTIVHLLKLVIKTTKSCTIFKTKFAKIYKYEERLIVSYAMTGLVP